MLPSDGLYCLRHGIFKISFLSPLRLRSSRWNYRSGELVFRQAAENYSHNQLATCMACVNLALQQK